MYKAWIKIVNLPFECWSEECVTAIVHGFGRFLRADTNSINLVDLIGFRCLIAIDDLTDIPEHLSISMGDLIVFASVRIESTTPFGGDDRGIPFVGGDPSKAGDQTDPHGRSLARRATIPGSNGDEGESRDGLRSWDTNTWNPSEIRDRRRADSDKLVLAGSGVAALIAGRRQRGAPGVACLVRPAGGREPLDSRLGPRILHHSCSVSKVGAKGGAPMDACLGGSVLDLPRALSPVKERGLPRAVHPLISWGSLRLGAPSQVAHHVGAVHSLPPLSALAKGEVGCFSPGPASALGPPLTLMGPPPTRVCGPPHPWAPRPLCQNWPPGPPAAFG